MKPTRFFPLYLIVPLLLTVSTSFIYSQEEEQQPTFTSESGTEVFFGDNTDYKINNVQSENPTIILAPQEGHKVASVRIRRGTEENWLFGKEIQYQYQTEAFKLDGNARIERGEDILIGPKQIVFDPQKNILTVEGFNKKNPAKVLYAMNPKTQIYSEALKFNFIFEQKGNNRQLKSPESVNNYQTHIIDGKTKPSPNLMRKLSGPK